jgi:hypothetical protein
MGEHENAKNGFGFAFFFLERYHKDGHTFLNHIVRVTDHISWISLANIEIKDKSKQWMHTHSPKKPKKFKQKLSVRKMMATVSETGKES